MEFDIERPHIEKSESTVRKDLLFPWKQQDLIDPGSLTLIILKKIINPVFHVLACVSVLVMVFRYYLMVPWFFCSYFRLSVSLTS